MTYSSHLYACAFESIIIHIEMMIYLSIFVTMQSAHVH